MQLLKVAILLESLHRLKIGETDSVIESLEFYLAFDAEWLYEATKEEDISNEEKTKIYDFIILLSVPFVYLLLNSCVKLLNHNELVFFRLNTPKKTTKW